MIYPLAKLFPSSDPCTFVQFGTKDILIAPSKKWDNKVFIKLVNKEDEEIEGAHHVIMEFPKVESIDTLIKALKIAKKTLTKPSK